MLIQRLVMQNFRNLQHVELDPVPGFNLICGPNGAGKTSVLEAIYYLALGRSFRLASNQYLVQQGQSTLSLFAQVQEELNAQAVLTTIGMSRTRGEDLMIKVNFDPLARLIDLIDHICVQVIHPQGIELITKESEGRRSFIDWGVYYSDPSFKQLWWDYRKALKQRNALLRQTTTRHKRRSSLLLEPFYSAPIKPLAQAQGQPQTQPAVQPQTQSQSQLHAPIPGLPQSQAQSSSVQAQPLSQAQTQVQAQAGLNSLQPNPASMLGLDAAGQPYTISPVLQRAMDNALNGETTERLPAFNLADYPTPIGPGLHGGAQTLAQIGTQAGAWAGLQAGTLTVNALADNLSFGAANAQFGDTQAPWATERPAQMDGAILQSTAWNLSVAQNVAQNVTLSPGIALGPASGSASALASNSALASVSSPGPTSNLSPDSALSLTPNTAQSTAQASAQAPVNQISQAGQMGQTAGLVDGLAAGQAAGQGGAWDAQQRRTKIQAMWSNPVSEFAIWNEQIAELSEKITQKRLDYLKNLQLVLQEIIEQFLPNFKLKFELYFGWDKGSDLRSQLAQNLEKERGLGYTLYGCHRADLKIKNHNLAAGATLSRGQLKMLVYAMRLAQGMLLKQQTQRSCIYLIDDLNSELDENSQRRLLNTLLECQHQVFISNIQSDFRNTLIPHGRSDIKVFSLDQGRLVDTL